jgi:hypothetical protein
VGISKHLKARLARLEAKVEALPDLEAEESGRGSLSCTFLPGLLEAPSRISRRRTATR